MLIGTLQEGEAAAASDDDNSSEVDLLNHLAAGDVDTSSPE